MLLNKGSGLHNCISHLLYRKCNCASLTPFYFSLFGAGFTAHLDATATAVEQLIANGESIVVEQLTAMATSLQDKFDARSVLTAVTAAYIGFKVGSPASQDWTRRFANAAILT
jgi:hypothetical protein